MNGGKTTDGSNGSAGSPPLELRISRAQAHLGERRRRLIRSILDDSEETVFLSSRDLARRFGVDAATVVRTIQALGYERFADFSADLRQHYVTQVKPYTQMKAATARRSTLADRISGSLANDAENINHLCQRLDARRIEEAARLIHRSRRVLVVGVDLSVSLAWTLAFGLRVLGVDADAPVGSNANLRTTVNLLGAKDLVIAITFGRCVRATIEAVRQANARGIPVLGITDGDHTPLARYSDSYLLASIEGTSFVPSFAAPVALINAVLIACAHSKPKHSLDVLEQNERELESGGQWWHEEGGSRDVAPANAGDGDKPSRKRPAKRRS